MDLSIAHVVNISVAQTGAGLSEYNTSNIGLFTHEKPEATFGTGAYKIYRDPSQVAKDFGSNSVTYLLALAAFNPKPNFLAGSGYFAVIPMIAESQSVELDAAPTVGGYKLALGADESAEILFSDTIAQIQTKLRAIPKLGAVVVSGTPVAYNIHFAGVASEVALLTVEDNTLTDGTDPVVVTVEEIEDGETLAEAVNRAKSLVQFFGILSTYIPAEAEMLAMAAVVQTLNKIAATASYTPADVEVGGKLDKLRTGSLDHTRGLFYGSNKPTDAEKELEALKFAAAYLGRGLSVIFSGSNTTMTMHLKQLSGIQPDPTMDETLFEKCKAAGADTYPSIQGRQGVFCSGKNRFFDQVYNLGWFVGSLEVNGFNTLAQTSTKIEQTEDGVASLAGAYRKVCETAKRNNYVAPGEWNSPNFFGIQSDMIENIRQFGYYIYTTPVAQQLPADREDRQAPLCQIAIKEAGAIHSSTVIVNVNA